jgi:hypothetical protein
LLAIAGSGAIALLVFGIARGHRGLRRAAAVVVLAVAVGALVSWLVETPREMALRRTEEMVLAYAASDWARLDQLIDADTRFASLLKGHEIVEAAQLTQEALGANPISISRMEAHRDDVGVVVTFRVRTEVPQIMHPITTGWRFDYRRLAGQWRLDRVDPLATEQIDENAILRNVRLPPSAEGRR